MTNNIVNKQKKKVKRINIFLKILMIIFILFVLISLTLLLILFLYSRNLNYKMPEVVEVEIYNNDNELITKINNVSKRSYVRIDDINQNIIDCFLTIEDKEYYNHQGVNIKRIIGAFIEDVKNKDFTQGGSTITQQYVKNTFLSSEKTIKRKLDEALIAIHLETKYSKNEILEGYLNTIYFDHGITGINDASLFYFNKYPKDITLNEAAILASIPKSPSNYSPIKNHENNNNRRKLILLELLNDGKITKDYYNELINKEESIYGCLDSTKISNSPYYQDVVLSKLTELNINLDKSIKVYTSIDHELNVIIEKAIEKYYDKNSNLELAIVAMDTDGNILANIGGVDYLQSSYNRAFSLRQPGSTIKSFLYYTALKNGFNVSHTFYSSKTTFYVDGNEYSPGNFGEIYPDKDVSMIYAIATSDNIYAVKTHLYLGMDKLYNTLKDFGFTSEIKENASLALGTSEVSLIELTTGYTKIASLGKDIKASYINKITDFNDNILYTKNYNYEQKYDYNSCYLLSEALTSVFDARIKVNATPTCASIKSFLSTTYAAKSGSTDYDGLIVGYNKNIVLGIWTGYDDNSIIENKQTKFIKYIWASVMEDYNKEKKNTWYETPKGIIAIKLNPIDGKFSFKNDYKKYLYFDIYNLPDFI